MRSVRPSGAALPGSAPDGPCKGKGATGSRAGNVKQTARFIVTRRETLNILGIRKASLTHLERAAKLSDLPGRGGYTAVELKRLLAELRKILGL